jgi:GxxExxY protein
VLAESAIPPSLDCYQNFTTDFRCARIAPNSARHGACSAGAVLIRLPSDEITNQIIGCAIEVHRELGPGLLESCYRACLARELEDTGVQLQTEVPVPVIYKGEKVDCGYRLDIVVNELVVIEVKAVDKLAPVHTAQVLTYLRLAGYEVGLLINFNTRLLKDGIKRVLNTVGDG